MADIARLHGEAFLAKFRPQLTSVQKKALRDIQNCRTPFFGGHLHQCDHCGEKVYSYHSCRNRSCPKCHHDQTERWIARQRARLLPCPYYLLTFTLPAQLRRLAQTQPKTVYSLLMKAAADALQKLARDPRFLGARLGCLAVLHTWTRAMLYHPHVHMLVTAGGLSLDGTRWIPPQNPKFLVPVRALSLIFKAKMCAALKKARLLQQVPCQVWDNDWVVHCQHAGSGDRVLQYLGRYVFRIAITNARLEHIQDGLVTFKYRDNRTHFMHHATVSGIEFLRRFLQHVLPRGCSKVRYYGIFSSHCQDQLDHARSLIPISPSVAALSPSPISNPCSIPDSAPHLRLCPLCRSGNLVAIEVLLPQRTRSP